MGDKIRIEIDEELQEIAIPYFEKRKAEVATLKDALSKKDFATLQSIGHKLKGNSGGYGFDRLGELGAELEIAAKAKEDGKIAPLLVDVENYLSSVEIVFVKVS